MDKTRTSVRIFGAEYMISGVESAEYIHRVALYVDRKISEIGLASRVPNDQLPVLTCLNIADELFKSQDEIARLRKELNEHRQESAALRAERVTMQEEIAQVQKDNTLLRNGHTPELRSVRKQSNR